LRTLREEYPDLSDRLPDFERIDLHVYPDRLNFGLIIFDDRIIVVGYRGNTRKVCIESSNEKFMEWAVEVFDRYREASRWLDMASLCEFSEEDT
jgi:predicted transcriptional regulator